MASIPPLPAPLLRVWVSACLLGEAVRYDGGHEGLEDPVLRRWLEEGRVVPFCPEVAGGLGVPRPPAERGRDGRVRRADGTDVSAAFQAGAEAAVAEALAQGAVLAVLKEHSPACGVTAIHDGSFQGRRVPGQGVAAEALRAAGLAVFSERQLAEADAWLAARVITPGSAPRPGRSGRTRGRCRG